MYIPIANPHSTSKSATQHSTILSLNAGVPLSTPGIYDPNRRMKEYHLTHLHIRQMRATAHTSPLSEDEASPSPSTKLTFVLKCSLK